MIGLAFAFGSLVIGVWVGAVMLRRLADYRPTMADAYCCGCTGRLCSWGCCHRSCIDHDPDAISEAQYFAEWAGMREDTEWS